MRSYNAGGIRGYLSTTNNYGTRIISNTRVVSPASTALENTRFTFSSGANFTFEFSWYEFNIFNNGTHWTWWGSYGGWVNTSGNYNGRFGPTVKNQAGTNNGVGYMSGNGTNAIWWMSRTYSPSQNISSLYLAVTCDRWDLVTVTYS